MTSFRATHWLRDTLSRHATAKLQVMDEHMSEFAGEVSVGRSVWIPAEPVTVWSHLTEGDLVTEWMGGETSLDAKPGGSIRLQPETGPTVWGTVEEVVPGRRLQWSWRTDDGLPTQVEIEIEPESGGSRVIVTETLVPWRVSGLPPQIVDRGPVATASRNLLAAA